MTISNNTLYGTALLGGTNGEGTVFKINTDGTGFTNLYTFSAGDGALPNGTLTLSGNTLYGTTSFGGDGAGVLFKVNTDGSGFTNFYSFTGGDDGSLPVGLLLLSGNTLYGATLYGGANGNGTLFAINTNGTEFTTLYTFSAGGGTAPYITNSDGANPSLKILTNNTLYGRAGFGTSSGDGSVFKINIDGTGFTNLHNFTGSDGADPGSAVLSGNTLYGTASRGGTNGDGTVFSLSLPLAVNTTSLPNGTNGIAYSQTLSASFGQPAYTWTISLGALPRGLTLAANGIISGTPTTNGTFNFTVKVTDATNGVATQAMVLTVIPLQVTTVALPNGMNGLPYSFQLSAIFGQLPFSWWLISGSLPSGFALAINGIISGTPTNSGTFNFTVEVTDANNNVATQALVLTVGNPPSVAIQPTNHSVAVADGSNLTFVALVGGTGPFSYQWQLNGTNLPNGIITTVAGNGYGAGTGTGSYSGDGGAATNAELYVPAGAAVDAAGNLFIADTDNTSSARWNQRNYYHGGG